MSNPSNVIVPVALAGVMNGFEAYTHSGSRGALETLFGNIALFGTLAAVGSFFSWDIAAALALLYFIATMLTSGEPVINWFSRLVGGN